MQEVNQQHIFYENDRFDENRFLERWNSANRNVITDLLPHGVLECFMSFLDGNSLATLTRVDCKLLKKCHVEKKRFPFFKGETSRVVGMWVQTILKNPLPMTHVNYLRLSNVEQKYNIRIFPSSFITSFDFFQNCTRLQLTEILNVMPHLQTLCFRSESFPGDNTSHIHDKSLTLLPQFTELKTLRVIGDFTFTSTGLSQLNNITSLENLSFICCSIDNSVLSNLHNTHYLKSLDLRRCPQLTDDWIDSLKTITTLKELVILDCAQINGTGFSNLTSLTSLDLTGDQFTATSLSSLNALPNLNTLSLSMCGSPNLESLTTLKSLSLDTFPLTQTTLMHLSHLPSLTSLHFVSCVTLTDARLRDLNGLMFLQHLRITSSDQITDRGVNYLNRLTSLETLTISSCNQITAVGLSSLNTRIKLTCSHQPTQQTLRARAWVMLQGARNQIMSQSSQIPSYLQGIWIPGVWKKLN